MRRFMKQKRGQFIVIAALMVAIMIVSIGAVMYGAVTYFRYERWEEYLAIVDNVKLGSYRVVEISLASYTSTLKNETLKNNLDQWRSNITKAYLGFGLTLIYSNATLARYWYNKTSFSVANATIFMNITSVGLKGYEFAAYSFLRMKILDALWYTDRNQVGVRLVVDKEDSTLITNLQKGNFIQFEVNGTSKAFTFYRYYDGKTHKSFVYELCYDSPTKPSTVTVTITVMDFRSVKVTGRTTLTVTNA